MDERYTPSIIVEKVKHRIKKVTANSDLLGKSL
jgi:hypothetical protein